MQSLFIHTNTHTSHLAIYSGLTVRNNTDGYVVLQIDGTAVISDKKTLNLHVTLRIHYVVVLANNSYICNCHSWITQTLMFMTTMLVVVYSW